jgi:hypothetical protein
MGVATVARYPFCESCAQSKAAVAKSCEGKLATTSNAGKQNGALEKARRVCPSGDGEAKRTRGSETQAEGKECNKQ